MNTATSSRIVIGTNGAAISSRGSTMTLTAPVSIAGQTIRVTGGHLVISMDRTICYSRIYDRKCYCK